MSSHRQDRAQSTPIPLASHSGPVGKKQVKQTEQGREWKIRGGEKRTITYPKRKSFQTHCSSSLSPSVCVNSQGSSVRAEPGGAFPVLKISAQYLLPSKGNNLIWEGRATNHKDEWPKLNLTFAYTCCVLSGPPPSCPHGWDPWMQFSSSFRF